MSNLLETKLTPDQQKLIEENYKKVGDNLRYIFRSSTQSKEFISHTVEAAQRYDPSKSEMAYDQYATSICCHRKNDFLRKVNKENRTVCLDNCKQDMALKAYNKNIALIDWEDTKQNILRKMEFCFKQDSKSFRKNRADQAYKILIAEYLLPMCEFEKEITLKDVSNITGLKIPTLSLMIHGKKMRNFIKSCL